MKNYVQDDKLKDLIDWEKVMPMPRYAGGHDDQMRGLLRGAVVLAHWNEGDWQGSVATMVRLPDGRVAAYTDYYGSCPGCDCWDGASDENVRKLCTNLANGAYVWPSEAEARSWLEWAVDNKLKDGVGYQWHECAEGLLGELRKKNPPTKED